MFSEDEAEDYSGRTNVLSPWANHRRCIVVTVCGHNGPGGRYCGRGVCHMAAGGDKAGLWHAKGN